MKEQKPPLFSNKVIVIIKILTACILWFAASLFFFMHARVFLDDFLSPLFFMPIFFFGGLILVLIYIGFLVGRIEDKRLFLADKYDIPYKIMFSALLIFMNIRSLFIEPYLNIPITIIVLSLVSGAATWLTPRLVENNNEEF
ncbi:MAG: hypothetical protein FWE16_03810 [Firmicutes bacterium]|nr:hypothetical protein [Bacillota bacterium]